MAKVQFVVEAHYEWGGDEVGTFDSLEAATEATKKYLAELERDAATGEEIEDPQSITMMPQVDGCDVPTQGADWLFSGWSHHPTAEDILSDYIDVYPRPEADPLTLAEAAKAYPIAYSTLAQAVREGRLDARQSGKTWLTTREAVDRAIAESKLRPRKRK